MNDGLVPNRYAKALYKHAVESGELEQVYGEMKRLESSYAENAKLKAVANNPFIDFDVKSKLLLTAAGARPGGALERFVALLDSKNRMPMLRPIALSFMKLYREERGIAKVTITTAVEFSRAELDRLVDLVKQRLNGKELELTVQVDPEIIGGFIIDVDSQVLDASTKNDLNKLRLKLLS
ncbi:MAG: ATP synthase F1 subunit delta [Muribaculaceae bacterium]|nr:ATP synthase F1 subunit delta [Muribaculaceae bacterium]